MGCHFLRQCIKVKSESEVAQSCPTLRDPMDCSPPGSSIHGIFQARVLEWGAIAFSAFSCQSSDEGQCVPGAQVPGAATLTTYRLSSGFRPLPEAARARPHLSFDLSKPVSSAWPCAHISLVGSSVTLWFLQSRSNGVTPPWCKNSGSCDTDTHSLLSAFLSGPPPPGSRRFCFPVITGCVHLCSSPHQMPRLSPPAYLLSLKKVWPKTLLKVTAKRRCSSAKVTGVHGE